MNVGKNLFTTHRLPIAVLICYWKEASVGASTWLNLLFNPLLFSHGPFVLFQGLG